MEILGKDLLRSQRTTIASVGRLEGSELGASGNSWLKPGHKITDKTSPKDVLVLAQPTMATESLKILYDTEASESGLSSNKTANSL